MTVTRFQTGGESGAKRAAQINDFGRVTQSELDVGRRFGRLLVVGVGAPDSRRMRRLVCSCDCGTTREMNASGIREGRSLSCGCLRRERALATVRKHGWSQKPTYRSWVTMLGRCYDPRNASYEAYHGKGITVCQEWRDNFLNFLGDMGERPSLKHSLDRIDNDGNYEPNNCRWATAIEQQANRACTSKHTALGETLPVTEWCRRTGISSVTFRARVRAGWSADDVVTIPVRAHKRAAAR